ncbi:MAG: type IV pilus assembly protein PilM [Patescibacteria group bacterium]
MGLFSGKGSAEANFLGVDIGGSSLKVVELTNNNGRAQLVTYGYLERSLKGDGQKLIDDVEKTASLLRKVCDSAKVVTNRAITALPGQAVFNAIISISEMAVKDLASPKKITTAVEWEAKKVLPLPLEEMILDWKIITPEDVIKKQSETGDKIKNLQILLTGAAKNIVQKYIDIFKKANLNLISLETESFALARSLVGKDRSTVVVVDIGGANSDITVIDGGLPLLSRSLGVGGVSFTQNISTTLNVSMEQAEQYKRDLANMDTPEGQLPEIVERAIRTIVDEVQYTINFYLDQPDNKNKKIERVVLTGGSSSLFNLPKYFSDKLGIRTFIGNPWARVIYPLDLQEVLDGIGNRLATAVGLAMRDIE